jgi:hypothetical protein
VGYTALVSDPVFASIDGAWESKVLAGLAIPVAEPFA